MMQTSTVVRLLALVLSSALVQPAVAQTTRLDPTFQIPQIRSGASSGVVRDVVQQADGKYVIGGTFSTINGVRARNLARLHADGTLDAAFTANCPANGTVSSLALQPNGSILVGGSFDSLAAGQRRGVGRLLPSGTLDGAFDANLPSGLPIVQVAALPGGDVLARTSQSPVYTMPPPKGLYRLSGQTGQNDPAFQQAVQVNHFVVQADGRIVTGGGGGSYVLMHLLARLLPDGSLDPSYPPATTYFSSNTYQVAVDEQNNIYRLGTGNTLAGLTGPGIVQNDWGSLSPLAFQRQPNGRILLAGLATGAGPSTARLLPNGQQDASYQPAAGPTGPGQVLRMLVQPNGAILMAGSFAQAGATPVFGLVRMLDVNVLSAKDKQPAAGVVAWPVPATTHLNLRLTPAAAPQQLQLLDGLGRALLARVVPAATTTLALEVAALPAGVYTLRVSSAQAAPVSQRIVLQR
ncbi:MAG: hypothetical protein ACRYF0_12140 [Janthinobacterium lividum]